MKLYRELGSNEEMQAWHDTQESRSRSIKWQWKEGFLPFSGSILCQGRTLVRKLPMSAQFLVELHNASLSDAGLTIESKY